MKSISKYLFVLLFLFAFGNLDAQQGNTRKEAPEYSITGSVRERYTYKPIPKVNIEINGGAYTRTNFDGSFLIRAKKGDELVIRHKDFETVYYTIESDDRIILEVEPAAETELKAKDYKRDIKSFNALMDSVAKYKKGDVEKSIAYVGEALSQSSSQQQNAEAYLLLAEVYMYWKQYDLAVSNYRVSLQNTETNQAKLGLGKAYELNKNYQESLETYSAIDKKNLSNYQSIILYEGLGDTYANIKNYEAAISNYKNGLEIAKNALISPKEVDLNSKLAQVYNASGKAGKAEEFFGNAMDLASKQTKKRALEEKETVADFRNNNRNYSQEIELRKEIVKDVAEAERDSVIDNASALTSQKQNYKIGNAYFLQQNYAEAIPYLEKSIKEADAKADLVVKKDATRKLSDLYVSAGDFEKAKAAFEDYKLVVDELYLKREQELSQADRFRRNIREQQNRITSLESDRKLTSSLANERSKNQQLIIYSLIAATILLCVTAFFMYKYIKQQRLANNLLALKSLRSQMNPHFIFNALNSVNSFIAINDERTANKYLSDFSQLMRAVLENSEEDFIPLQKEIELLQLYTKLEHFRFKDKFDYEIKIDDDVDVAAYQIPPMLLQPYIENAVWHGLRYKTEKGKLQILIENKTVDEITISVLDDGIGRARSKALKTENQQKQNSKGMGNIKKRVAILNDMYKDKVDVAITDYHEEEDAGTKVVVTLRKD
ncbi:sensor histidine kinase [Subsaximicrobium wynnwilliamsii]|uniref:Sensor histidine kinase n=1 Tax=Subsaximicrobium wynnwilliamsii TaxID=291179 RepID=A0A5C6ZFB4_9FLAO|nr:histidine kinase [Subsaximicrobium wynnwilliamsii]TXD82266.1 sensor histidine kinase [Subsaximicrobium wynnwilliamsii]TXD87904.1 sensor histidine kinase [Subsaximicrobium wynnwilliamsii]TXE01897.1 sensor histidine kinase [Subsaximicrobium wynnwilliamsii]